MTPFGGGSSVVGGVEPTRDAARHNGAVTVDLRELGRVLEVDETSRAARIEAGAFGPALEAQLKPHGLTLRHFPQSFECSTLGGWIATRSGGHFATLYTHIDDLVKSLRVISPQGVVETRRLPGSGAGPSPDRLLIGSEGILGIITQAWMRLQDRPKFRGGGAVQFADFFTAARALRAISQAGLFPANCRILDPQEAFNTGAADGSVAILVLAFSPAITQSNLGWRARSSAAPITAARRSAPIPLTPTAKARPAPGATPSSACPMRANVPLSAASSTIRSRPRSPGSGSSHSTTRSRPRPRGAILQATGRTGQVTCRCTHVYPDGVAPYFTFHAAGRHGELIAQWHTIKSAGLDAVIANGGTVTHHHAVGRDHRPWYDRQRPPLFAAALRAAKATLDPHGLLNPGVLIDP